MNKIILRNLQDILIFWYGMFMGVLLSYVIFMWLK